MTKSLVFIGHLVGKRSADYRAGRPDRQDFGTDRQSKWRFGVVFAAVSEVARNPTSGPLPYLHPYGIPLRFDGQDLVAVGFQAGRGLAGGLGRGEKEFDDLSGGPPAQFMPRLDVVQRATVGGQIDRFAVFF
jgi:hypothetical protein